ncbi:MAG: hypothetical protein F6J89_13565 [Symploca sp. SIO1C4]|uniref:DUF2283 domain-containing protein n=1 Tax=Symploca sp. SIO1C4 TaxID=2607765 RepID=A0A6B3NDD2_9CYAN|nr:hypothetical protein [Symploca sp. SIO1C4]NET04242.1 hypothetical protein [Symploca sp. SIO2B6]
MKIFIKFNSEGKILSISKLRFMPEGMEHPYGILEENEDVIEVPLTEELMQIETVELHDTYQIDIETKQLVKKT